MRHSRHRDAQQPIPWDGTSHIVDYLCGCPPVGDDESEVIAAITAGIRARPGADVSTLITPCHRQSRAHRLVSMGAGDLVAAAAGHPGSDSLFTWCCAISGLGPQRSISTETMHSLSIASSACVQHILDSVPPSSPSFPQQVTTFMKPWVESHSRPYPTPLPEPIGSQLGVLLRASARHDARSTYRFMKPIIGSARLAQGPLADAWNHTLDTVLDPLTPHTRLDPETRDVVDQAPHGTAARCLGWYIKRAATGDDHEEAPRRSMIAPCFSPDLMPWLNRQIADAPPQVLSRVLDRFSIAIADVQDFPSLSIDQRRSILARVITEDVPITRHISNLIDGSRQKDLLPIYRQLLPPTAPQQERAHDPTGFIEGERWSSMIDGALRGGVHERDACWAYLMSAPNQLYVPSDMLGPETIASANPAQLRWLTRSWLQQDLEPASEGGALPAAIARERNLQQLVIDHIDPMSPVVRTAKYLALAGLSISDQRPGSTRRLVDLIAGNRTARNVRGQFQQRGLSMRSWMPRLMPHLTDPACAETLVAASSEQLPPLDP